MTHSTLRFLGRALGPAAACLFSVMSAPGASIVAGPGEAGLRAAVDAAQAGDTVLLTNYVDLESSLRITKRLTIRSSGDPSQIWLRGSFEGALLQVAADGIAVEALRLIGSVQTDGLSVEKDVVVRDGSIEGFRRPVVENYSSFPQARVCLEGVTVRDNHAGLECQNLDAKNSVFSNNRGNAGVGGANVYLQNCEFANNEGHGLFLIYGTVQGCTFRFNGGMGIWFDPDPGVLNLSDSLFYANAGGGILLREEAIATIDNCTFTRHTGFPAISISEAHEVLLRHCTVADNMVIVPEFWPWYPVGGAVAIGFNGRVELQNCIVADNPTADSPNDSNVVGSYVDGGGNVIGGSALLSSLGDHGGPTLSLLPLPGSPALDAGVPSQLVVDARGLSRTSGLLPDAGAVEAGAGPSVDADADGLPDLWEIFYHLNPADAADAAADIDGDGQTALAEFRTRTDPSDPLSVHRMRLMLAPASAGNPFPRDAYIIWSLAPGLTYEVEASTDLQQWHRIPGPYYLYGKENNRWNLLTQVQAASLMSFYRVRVKESACE